MLLSAIVAVARNGVIGDGDDIPWRLSTDLKYFKKTTSGHAVIMGRKTFATLDRPLPNRTNIILTRNLFFVATGTIVTHEIKEALTLATDLEEEEVFIIGGGEIYRQALPYCDRVYLTEVDADAPGEVTFPELDSREWKEISREAHPADDRNDHAFAFVVYDRIQE